MRRPALAAALLVGLFLVLAGWKQVAAAGA